jgi:heat shock protein HslJ
MSIRSAALAAAFTIACSAPPPPGAAAGSSSLEGPVWRLVRARGGDEQALASLAPRPSLRFEAGRVEGFGGCNRFAGSYAIEAERVTLGPLAGTMMACDEPAMRVEAAFTRALSGTLAFRVAAGRLELGADPDQPELVLEAAPPPSLEGVTWEVTGFNNGRQAVVGPRADTKLTLSFADGAVTGHAGCNRFQASYTREGERLAIGPAAATRMSCPGEGVMEQEREFLAALGSATTWEIDARGMLDLHRADGERALIANPVSE